MKYTRCLFFAMFLWLIFSCTKEEIIYIPKEDISQDLDEDDDVNTDPEVVVEINLPKGNFARYFGAEYSNESNIVRLSLSNELNYEDEYHSFMIEIDAFGLKYHERESVINGRLDCVALLLIPLLSGYLAWFSFR